MSRVRSMQYDNQDNAFWDEGQEYRKRQSAKQRCKQRKTKSIRQGIEDYWDRRQIRQNPADLYDDDDFDYDDLDFYRSKH